MMESRPRSVLAAFQEHLQLASTKCGSLMEQLNIVRKKVEGKEAATMNVSDPVSDDFLKNVSQKTVLQSEEMDLLDRKDVLKEQMAVGNAYVERSTGDTNRDVNKDLIIRKSSQHSEIIVNKEEVPFLNGNVTANEKERYSLKCYGGTDHKPSEEKLIKETEKISERASLNVIADKEEESFNQDLSSDDESTLSSCSSSNGDGKEASHKENIYEELLKRLKDNEEKKNINKNRSSSENSSSTCQKSRKTNKSTKKNSSNSTINEDKFDKKNGDIENLDVGVDFFLPSSVTEKFQEMFYEDSGEEGQNSTSIDKNMRVTFDDLIIGRPNKHHSGGETYEENKSPQNPLLKTSLKAKISPYQTDKQVSIHRQNGKVRENNCEISSVGTKSERTKKQNTVVNSPTLVNSKLHSPEMNLYKRLNGAPLKYEVKKNYGRKDIKSKKTTNSRLKAKLISADPMLKTLPDKKNILVFNNSKNGKTETEPPRTINNIEKDGGKDMIIKNNTQQNNNYVANKNLHKKSRAEIIATNTQPKNVVEAKLISDGNVKRDSLVDLLNRKEEMKLDNIINSDPKNQILKKNLVNKVGSLGNLKEKLNSDSKNMISKKNHAIIPDDRGILREKLAQAGKKATVKEKKPDITKMEYHKRNNMRTLTAVKELSSKHNSINEEIPAINVKLKNSKERIRPNTSAQFVQPKKESNKHKLSSARKEETFDIRNLQPLDKSSRTREPSESLKGRNNLARVAVHSQSINEMKAHTTSFPFILGQSTSKTYNVRAAIQQTMSMIMRSPAETLRRSSFSEMLNSSSKASTLKTSASCTSGRKVCPACVMRVDEEENEVDDNPIDPWDTEYHSKRFIRCTCMPRNTVNFKTVMNQLLHETSSSYILPTESYQDSELENGEDNRVNKVLFRRNNNIYKLSKLLHTLLKIRDLLVT